MAVDRGIARVRKSMAVDHGICRGAEGVMASESRRGDSHRTMLVSTNVLGSLSPVPISTHGGNVDERYAPSCCFLVVRMNPELTTRIQVGLERKHLTLYLHYFHY